jgi:probable F420-dependent oxidoreductase
LDVRFSLILPLPAPTSAKQVLEFAEAADELGYHAVYMNSRVARPVEIESAHPYMPDGRAPWPPDINWPDAFVVFSTISARTTRLRFGPAVVPVIVTHPLALAKQAATLDVYSGGRLELGLGAGWMLEEAHAVARPADRRWQRLEETIDILRLSWSRDTFSYKGRCYEFSAVGQHPHPMQGDRVPIWIGGHGQRALEITAHFGAGLFLWGGYPPEKVAEYVQRVHALSRDVPVATLIDSTTPFEDFDGLIGAMEKAGADMLVLSRFPGKFGAHLDVIRRFADRYLAT